MNQVETVQAQVEPQVVSEILAIVDQHRARNYTTALTSYTYFGDGPNIYEALINSLEYPCFTKEKLLLNSVSQTLCAHILDYADSLQVVDLGVGNGLKWERAFELFQSKLKTEYLGIDISSQMIDVARQHFCGPRITYALSDFLDVSRIVSHLSKDVGARIISMLGNTICNFIDDSRELNTLKHIQEYDSTPSFVLLGLEVFTGDVDAILKAYRNDLTKSIDIIPLEIVGLDKRFGTHEIIFNPELSRIEEWFRISTDCSFTPPYSNQELALMKDDAILLSITKKPTEHILLNRLGSVWQKSAIKLFTHDTNAIVVILPKELCQSLQ